MTTFTSAEIRGTQSVDKPLPVLGITEDLSPEVLAAARRTLEQCGAMDLAPMLGLDS